MTLMCLNVSGAGGDEEEICELVTVKITTDEVVCPGHLHRLSAKGEPGGGTFQWTLSLAGVRSGHLVDSSGTQSTTTGDSLYFVGIGEGRAIITVEYSTASGRATNTTTLLVHKIEYEVTDFWVKRGVTGITEGSNLKTGALLKATFAMDPKVKIMLSNACPRKAACAANHRVGWLQTLTSVDRAATYAQAIASVVLATPILDSSSTDDPFYHGPFVKTFQGDNDQQTAHHEDSPSSGSSWSINYNSSNQDLQHHKHFDRFVAWLVAQNSYWASNYAIDDSFDFLQTIAWRCGL